MHKQWKYFYFSFGRDMARNRDCLIFFMFFPRPDLAGDLGAMIPHLWSLELSWDWPMFITSHIPKDTYKVKENKK